MATQDQEKKALETLKASLSQLVGISLDSLRKMILGDELNFESALPFFKRNLDLVKRLNSYNLENLPFSIISSLITIIQQQLTLFKQVQEFSLKKYPQNALQTRDTFIAQIRDSYDTLFASLFPLFSYLSEQDRDFIHLESQAQKKLESIESIRVEIESLRNSQLAEVNSILENVRKAAAQVGVSQHASNFAEEAKYHEKKGLHWLFATVSLTVINVIYALVIAFYYTDVISRTMTTSQIVQSSVSKLIAFSILSFGMIWCSRSYRAHRNGHIINRHRQNALSTFETFVKAASDEQTKNAVLLQAAQSIFIPQCTGYLTTETEQVQSTKILEVIRGVIAKE